MDVLQELQQLRRELERANYEYYVLDEPTMSDYDFDHKLRRLEELEAAHPELVTPDSPTQRVGGMAAEGFAEVVHQVPLESLQDVFSFEELEEFGQRAKEAVEGAVDVIVADGYSGNIFLKAVEGAGLFLTREMKRMFTKSVKTKLAALLMKDGLRDFKKLLDSNEVGGTALVGISRPVIKAHGNSDGKAFKNAIRQAMLCCQNHVVEEIAQSLKTIVEDEDR